MREATSAGALPAPDTSDALHTLDTLDRTERTVLTAAALAGEDADLYLLAHVAQADPGEVADAVDRLAGRGLLRGVAGSFGFGDPRVRAAAGRLAGPGWLARAHERAAEYLRRHHAPLTWQARHLEHAARLGDDAAAKVLVSAAQTMLGTAPEVAVRWLRVALRVLPERAELAERRAWIRVQLAGALVSAGRLTDGQAELADLRTFTGRARTSAVRQLAHISRLLGDLPAASALARGELDRASDPRAKVGLRFELLTAELLTGRWRQAVELTVAMGPEHDGHPGVRAVTAALHTLGAVPGGRLAELLDRLDRARTLVDGLDDGTLCDVLDVLVPLSWVELLVDQNRHALGHLDRGLRLAQRYRQANIPPQLYPARSLAYARLGLVAESLRAAEDAERTAVAVGSTEMRTFALALKLRPQWLRQGRAAAAGTLTELADAPAIGSGWHRLVADMLIAEALLTVGRAEDCAGQLSQWLTGDQSGLGALSAGSCVLLGRARLAGGDPAGARTWLDRAGTLVTGTPLAGPLGQLAHVQAALLVAERRGADAIALARAAADQLDRAELPVRAAEARLTLASALLLDSRGDQLAAARAELAAASRSLAGAGADWLAGEADRELHRLGARLPRTGPAAGGRLTPREQEIAELVADGLTSRAIATRLFLSPRTVDAHVGRILAKLDISSRAAIARRLADLSHH